MNVSVEKEKNINTFMVEKKKDLHLYSIYSLQVEVSRGIVKEEYLVTILG